MSISAFLISHLMREIVFRQQAGAGLARAHNQSVCTNILLVFVFPLYPFCIEHIKHYSFAARWGVLEAHQTKSMVAQTLMTDNGNV